MIIGLGSTFWGNSIFVLSEHMSFLEAEYLPYHIKVLPLIFSHFGILFAYHTTSFLSNPSVANASTISTMSFQKSVVFYKVHTQTPLIKIYTFFNQKWHFDDLYNRFIVQRCVSFGYHISFQIFDAGWIAYLGPYGIARTVNTVAQRFGLFQTGLVYHYASIMLGAITLFILFLFSWAVVGIAIPFWEHYALHFVFILTCFYLSTKSDPLLRKEVLW